ncbi:MAG: SHOCT domain-containing protein [Proteobacteria bacterium]|nr:SHOCT domain-containing protein [Pseudomonadota bacterium]
MRLYTLDHQIGGFSQQQSYGGSLSFTSQHGLIGVASLPVISDDGQRSAAAQQAGAAPASSGSDVFATIERLADLHAKGILGTEEFLAKKAELLSRV